MVLKPFTRAHFQVLKQWIDSADELIQFAGPSFSYPLTDAQLELYAAEPRRRIFIALEGQEGVPVGLGEVYRAGVNQRRLCRIIVSKAHRGKGYGRLLIKALLREAFADPEVMLTDLNVYDFNTAAIRCYEQCGFTLRPERKYMVQANGRQWVTLNMAITRQQYAACL